MSYTLKTTTNIPSQGLTRESNGRQFIVIHSTADPNATAANEATYFNREWQHTQTFVQDIVDDKEAYHIYPYGNRSWGAGNINSYAYGQIEICEFDDANRAKAAIANAAILARTIVNDAKAKGITIQIVSHHEATNMFGGSDHTDPDEYFARFGYTMDWFRGQVNGASPAPQPTPRPAPQSTPAPKNNLAVDGYDGAATWRAVQGYLNHIGYHLAVDGIRGAGTTKALQQAINAKLKAMRINFSLVVDGVAGSNTWKGLQMVLGTPVDGVKSSPSQMIMAMQKQLNTGTQWL